MASLGTIQEAASSSTQVSAIDNDQTAYDASKDSVSSDIGAPKGHALTLPQGDDFDAGDSDEEEFHFPGADLLPDVHHPLAQDEAPLSVMQTQESITQEEEVVEVAEDSDSEEFHFPGAAPLPSSEVAAGKQPEHILVSPDSSRNSSFGGSPAPALSNSLLRTQKRKPSPAQLESLHAAATSGDLKLLKNLFKNAAKNEDVEEFALANDASTRTGLTALHAAASRGHLEVVQWLIEHCGAMPDMEDKEGETALHKASLNGHLSVIEYLLPDRADIHCQDADGWTALHNACSKGYLDIVRWLCETGEAAGPVNGVPGVDLRSKGGWTPLMNAASKGHLPVVLYLLNKQNANPLTRNNWGETAYDAAAAVFEIWICEVLQKAEADRWRETTISYDPLAVHTTVPLVLYENQRLDTRFKTLAVSGGRPRFSVSGLGKRGRRPPFELRLPKTDPSVGKKEVPAWRSDVQLPLRENPWTLPTPGKDGSSREGAERSHFWLSDWTLDVTHPTVDVDDGWQYAPSFADPDEEWTADKPPQLQRLLGGSGAMSANFSGQSSSRPSSSRPNSLNSQTWVRRRRWVRVMRRRLDIPPLPFLEPDGVMYHFTMDGELVPYMESGNNSFVNEDGQEMGSMPSTGLSSSSAQDYVARARYLAGNNTESVGVPSSPVEARRAIAKLERATTELRQGMLNDEDSERKTQAEVLINAYSRELERRRLAAGAQGLLISGNDDEVEYDSDSDESFHYPGADPIDDAPSVRSHNTDYFSRQNSSRGPADLTPHLSQAPEFRVPTHEVPQKVMTPRWTPPTPHQVHVQWERDENVRECGDCRRRFNFLNRRHCRRCGHIFCDRCSSYRAMLDPSDVVHDPVFPVPMTHTATSHRVCHDCYDEVSANVPSGMRRSTSMERIFIAQERLSIPTPSRRQTSSQLSDLAECPVCNENLDELGPPFVQENHVKNCLEGGAGSSPQSAKYLVYKLPGESSLVGVECVICLEEFQKGSMVARLSCLCSFHNACLSSWLQRGRSCPVHAR